MDIDTIVTEYNTAKEEMEDRLSSAMKEAFKDAFAKFPNLYMICWAQYAPYFNDGDPCEFSVHEMYAVSKDFEGSEEEEDDPTPNPWNFEDDLSAYQLAAPESWLLEHYPLDARSVSWKNATEEEKKEMEGVHKFLTTIASIPDDVFEDSFGNDNAIYIYEDRIVVEDYSGDHD